MSRMPISTPPSRDPVSRLIMELSKLPGIGEKTATRLAHHILKQDESYSRGLADALLEAKQKIGLCEICFTFTDQKVCRICENPQRDPSVICVVERPSDVTSIEQSGVFRGKYHVLQGSLSPLEGIGPDELKIRELLGRLAAPAHRDLSAAKQESQSIQSEVKEIILATNPSVEGEATALYLCRLFAPFNILVTQLAHGIPMGGQLEYTDRQTLGKALENRREIHNSNRNKGPAR
jgi:recombination protein RecR